MAVTYVSAEQRGLRLQRERASQFGHADLVLVATSCVVALAIGLAYAGRVAVLDRSERAEGDAVNLSVVTRSQTTAT